jgi:putative FmdB family regulatory protein
MPIFDYQCSKCGHYWESIEVWESHKPTECPKCKAKEGFNKVIGMAHIRMDSDTILRSMPDPQPPLTELTPRKDSESGLKDLDRTELKDYVRTKDKYGNSVWKEKRRTYFYPGQKSRKSSAEKE